MVIDRSIVRRRSNAAVEEVIRVATRMSTHGWEGDGNADGGRGNLSRERTCRRVGSWDPNLSLVHFYWTHSKFELEWFLIFFDFFFFLLKCSFTCCIFMVFDLIGFQFFFLVSLAWARRRDVPRPCDSPPHEPSSWAGVVVEGMDDDQLLR